MKIYFKFSINAILQIHSPEILNDETGDCKMNTKFGLGDNDHSVLVKVKRNRAAW